MVHHAPRTFLPKTLRTVGTLLACGQNLAALFRIPLSALLASNSSVHRRCLLQQFPSGGLVRSRPPLAQAAGGNGPPCSLNFFENLTRRRHVACLRSTLDCNFSYSAFPLLDSNFIRPPPRPSTKIPKRSGSFDIALRLHRLRRAMVRYLARRKLWSLATLRL